MVLKGNVVSLSFGGDMALSLSAIDLMDSYLSFTPEGQAFNEIAGAFETILGANAYIRYSVEVHIRADSPKFGAYYDRIQRNANVDGGLSVTLDNNQSFTLQKVIIEPSGYTSDVKTGDGVFTIKGDLRVNKDLLGL